MGRQVIEKRKRTRTRKKLHRRLGDEKRIPLTTKLKKCVSKKMEKKYMQQNTDMGVFEYIIQTRFSGQMFSL